eukprot:385742-Lingulodinium_polyedra.AAC.1
MASASCRGLPLGMGGGQRGEAEFTAAWAEEIAVEWRDYAPLPPVAIAIGPARKRPREEPA